METGLNGIINCLMTDRKEVINRIMSLRKPDASRTYDSQERPTLLTRLVRINIELNRLKNKG